MPKPAQFHNIASCCLITGISTRQFRRLSLASGNPGLRFGFGACSNLKWTDAMIQSILAYRDTHLPGPVKGQSYPKGPRHNFPLPSKALKVA